MKTSSNSQWLVVGIILLFVGVTIAPTINFQVVKVSQQSIIKERINQRELLFQTIIDIANNKEIQRIILKSQMSRGIFPTSEMPVVTKNQLKMMYFLGLILSKGISKSRIQSMVQQYQFNNQEIQKEISAVIEKDIKIKAEISQLQTSECDCENENIVQGWYPFIICITLFLIIIGLSLAAIILELFPILLQLTFFEVLLTVLIGIAFIPFLLAALVFNCFDYPSPPNTEWTNQLEYLKLKK